MPNILTKYGRDGKVSYQALVRVDRRRPAKKTFDTYEEAELWRVAKDAELRALLVTPVHEYTLEEALVEYTQYFSTGRTISLAAKLADVISTALVDFQADRLEGLDDVELDLLETVVEFARKHMGVVIPENPVVALKARRNNAPYRPLTAFEEEQLLTKARNLANGTMTDILILALDTALLQQEILDLADFQIELGQKVIRMSATRVIPLTPRALQVVRRRLGSNTGRLFPAAPKNTVQTALIRLRKQLGLNGPDFNDMRKIALERLARTLSVAEVRQAMDYVKLDSLGWLLEGKFVRNLAAPPVRDAA
jgi:integrase